MADGHIVEEGKEDYEIGQRGFGFNLSDAYKERVVREGLSEYTYLLIFMKLWLGYWNNKLERMNMEVY